MSGDQATTPLSESDLQLIDHTSEAGTSLIIHHATGTTRAPLKEGMAIVVGREEPADVIVADDSLSRMHARFDLVDGQVWVEDLGSTNGTRINGTRIDQAWVTRGDDIMMGGVTAVIHGPSAEGVHGLRSHEQFRTLLEYEVLGARTFGRAVAVLMIGSARRLNRLSKQLRQVLRPVDQIALYGSKMLEVMLPATNEAAAEQVAQNLVQHGLRCGIAIFPSSGSSAEALIGISRSALQQATGDVPVQVAPDRSRSALARRASESGVVIESEAMKKVYDIVDRVARSNIPVVIHGETGTGKELIAEAIHARSKRAEHPLCCLNCGAIPDQLVESALFGHEKGAFTGASQQHKGVFESGDGGTVFLDEIGELSPEAQVALLRVLETKRLTRVGGDAEIEVDVRIIAATHRELEEMCEAGTFRMDLFYRLNTMVLPLPPLRERLEEIEALAAHFLEQANRANEREIDTIEPAALEALKRHNWPGNVRELKNAIERAVVIAQKDVVTLEDLPERIRALGAGVSKKTANKEKEVDVPPSRTPGHSSLLDFKTRVQQYEAALIEETLRDCDFNQSETSRRLKIPLRTLISKIQSYGIKK